MRAEDVLKLIDAGYTKDEISAMEDFPQAAEPQAAEPPAPQAAEPQAAEPQTAQQPSGYDEILDALNKLTNTMMAANINKTVAQAPERTVGDALAEIISPPDPRKRR